MIRIVIFLLCSVCMLPQMEGTIQEKVIICSVGRDVGKELPHVMPLFEQVGSFFSDYRIIVSEYNSEDNTPSLLYRWMRNNPKVHALAYYVPIADLETWIINKTEDDAFSEQEQLAHAKNIVVNLALSKEYEEFTHIIWLDMDLAMIPSRDAFRETFQAPHEWDAVFANRVDPSGNYYDWEALRDEVHPIGAELLGDSWLGVPKSNFLSSTSPWHPVSSASGGCAIYKKSALTGCRYSAIVTDDLETVVKNIIKEGKANNNPFIAQYHNGLRQLSRIVYIKSPIVQLPKITEKNTGIIIKDHNDPVIWKMNAPFYQYPSVCEHVPFHATMIVNGHCQLFINPRLVVIKKAGT